MEVRPGYKRTEVGIIPEDWNVRTIGQTFRLVNGCAFKPSDWKQSGTPIIRIQNLNDPYASFNYSQSPVSEVNRVEPGDLLFAWSGTIGTSFGARLWAGPSGVLNQHIFKVHMNQDEITLPFSLLVFARVEEDIAKQAHGFKASFLHVKKSDLVKVNLPVPPLSEQRAIAAALSDVDALLDGLERLITKKRDLKQAAMQQLLTGQTRLPGFSGEWDETALGDLCEYQNGTSLEYLFTQNEGFKVISIGNYSTSGEYVDNGIFISRQHSNLVEKFLLRQNDLAMSLNDKTSVGAIIGRVLLINQDDLYVFNQRTMRLRPKKGVSALFLHQALNSEHIHGEIVNLAKPGTQIYVNTDDVIGLKLTIPSFTEQTAIATILSDIDAELAALETRRDKTRALKQGMMQELLTGKTRLL